MRQSWRAGFIPVGIVAALALAFTSAGAQATGGGRIAAACSNETVTAFELPKPIAVTLRFVLHGVSCNKAHGLIRTYFRHEATPGYCRNRGNICAFVSGGYICSLPLYAGEGGGDFAACTRESPPATVVKVFKASSAAPPASASRSCSTERVQPGRIGPATAGSTGGPGIPYKIVVSRGSVSCAKARSLIKETGEGKGKWHEAPALSGIYTSFPGGWSCALATGGMTDACGADASGLPDTRMKSMVYSSSRWLRAGSACTPFWQ
jgi:hypothetical protein